MSQSRTRRVLSVIAVLGATCLSCIGDCDEPAPIVSGEYTVAERLYGGDDPSDDWTRAIAPGSLLSVDTASRTATLVYEREGTTYQVVFNLEN